MSYRIRFTLPDGRTGLWAHEYQTRETAQAAIDDRLGDTGFAYTVEEVPDASAAAMPDPLPDPTESQWPRQPAPKKPPIGVMPRRVWEEHRISALAEAIVRFMRPVHPSVPTAFDLARIRDWATEIVELCERHGGQQAKPSDAEAIRRLEADNRELRDRLAVAQRQRGEALAKATSVPEPGSTAAHHVDILRARVKELEAMVETLRNKLNETLTDNDDIHRDLAFALDLGQAMREAMRTGEWRAGHDRSMTSSAIAGWDRWKASLAASPQGTAKASEAPREGGDSERRRLEALERWLRGDTYRLVQVSRRRTLLATDCMYEKDVADAPTLAALADKLMEKEAKP